MIGFFFFQAEDGIRDIGVTGVQTCALPISDRRLVADATLARSGLGGTHDGERLLAVGALDDHLRADADAIAVALLDHRRVPELLLQGRDPALEERLLLLGEIGRAHSELQSRQYLV